MREKISRISLIVYVVLFLLSAFLLSAAGGRVEWFAVTGIFAIPPIVAGPRRYRILGAIGLAVAIAAAAIDFHAGQRLHDQIDKIRRQAEEASRDGSGFRDRGKGSP